MSKRQIKLLVSVIIFFSFGLYQLYTSHFFSPQANEVQSDVLGQKDNYPIVTKVVDGDTLEVVISGKKEKVRIIGINTPETVDPRKKVECFGKEASEKAKSLLLYQTVRLKSDPSQADYDRYGRLLRYVFLKDGSDFGLQMVKQGYAYEYTYDTPYEFQKEYRLAQQEAEELRLGLWGENGCER